MNTLEKIQLFLRLAQELYERGYKKKDLANRLGCYPSVYSSMVNGVFEKAANLDALDPQKAEIELKRLFASVNNLSEVKIRRNLDKYVEILQAVHAESMTLQSREGVLSYVEQLMRNSPGPILEKLAGLYEGYYLSTFGYQVKREPFLLQRIPDHDGLLTRKGNQHGPSAFDGFAYLSNDNVLTLQLREQNTNLHDNLLAHFIVPPSYGATLNLLRGVMVSIGNSGLPVARKIILKRVPGGSMADFEKMETLFYANEDLENAPLIVQYLYQTTGLLEFHPVPRPMFDEKDLMAELKIEMAQPLARLKTL